MSEQNTALLGNLEFLHSFQHYLSSHINIGEPEIMTYAVGRGQPFEREGVKITINVENIAPENTTGGNIVFTGVGLRITDGREGANSQKWAQSVSRTIPLDDTVLKQKYRQGAWTSEKSFPAVTPEEKEHGDVIFPGERISYELSVPPEDLPYLDIKVEGTVSRRHLLHIVHEMDNLKNISKSLIIETFNGIGAINIYVPLLKALRTMPELNSNTTLADVETFKKSVDSIVSHVDQARPELNKVYHSAPNQELRYHMKQEVGKYLTSVKKACNVALQALSSTDTQQMVDAAQSLRSLLHTSDQVKQKQLDLMAFFGVDKN